MHLPAPSQSPLINTDKVELTFPLNWGIHAGHPLTSYIEWTSPLSEGNTSWVCIIKPRSQTREIWGKIVGAEDLTPKLKISQEVFSSLLTVVQLCCDQEYIFQLTLSKMNPIHILGTAPHCKPKLSKRTHPGDLVEWTWSSFSVWNKT